MTETIEAPHETHPILGEYEADLLPEMQSTGVCAGNEEAATNAQREALATLTMRRMKAIQRDLDASDDALLLEIRALQDMQQAQTRAQRERLASYRRYVELLAELTEWGKKKSVDSPYGSYGVRSSSATVECNDRHTLAMWAAEHRPEFAEYEITVPVLSAIERFSPTELAEIGELDVKWNELKKTLDPSGELPPGVSVVPAARTPFAKVQ